MDRDCRGTGVVLVSGGTTFKLEDGGSMTEHAASSLLQEVR